MGMRVHRRRRECVPMVNLSEEVNPAAPALHVPGEQGSGLPPIWIAQNQLRRAMIYRG
jgi:hypothetical protein